MKTIFMKCNLLFTKHRYNENIRTMRREILSNFSLEKLEKQITIETKKITLY
jgi:hypothetical protein